MADDIDLNARRRFRRNHALATSLLLISGLALLWTHLVESQTFPVLLVRATCEAGIVGGLADWFAVTALFRHPLGLPIPHTAIIPKSKERIADALGKFVERHFLTEDAMVKKLRGADASRRFSEWLTTPDASCAIADAIVKALPYIIRSVEDRELQRFAQQTLGSYLRQVNAADLFGRGLRLFAEMEEAEVLLQRLMVAAERWLVAHKRWIKEVVAGRTPWWMPRTIDAKIAAAILDGALELLSELRDPHSDVRLKLNSALSNGIENLFGSEELRNDINTAKNRVLDHPDVQSWISALWRQFSQTVANDLANPRSQIRVTLERTIATVGDSIASDRVLQGQLDRFLERIAIYLASWRNEIGHFVSEVVKSWDTRVLTERLELVVGSDLQYIRINGTVVGASVGCLLYLVSHLRV